MHTQNTYAKGYAIMVNKPETVCEMNSSLSPEATAANQALFIAAPSLLDVLEEFVKDVRVAYIGTQDDDQLAHSALAHSWPDLCITYRKAVSAIAKARAGSVVGGTKCTR